VSTIQQVFDGLASTIHDATGLRVVTYVPDDLNPPIMFLTLGTIERGAMGRGQMEIPIDAVLLVQRASDRAGQGATYGYASFTGPLSIWRAVDNNKSLGLSDTDAAVIRYRPLGVEEVAAYQYYGGVFEILALTSGS
jgi:hypothetical protein